MKKTIAIALAVLMLCAMMVSVSAEETTTNSYIELKVEIPADISAPIEYYLTAFRIPNTVKFEVGDKLVYDVWMSEAAPGFGGMTLINGGKNLHDSGTLDKDGNNVHPSFDLSGFCTETWYTREITLPSGEEPWNMILDFEGLGIPFAYDVLPAVNVQADVVASLAGKTIIVRYDNIKLVAADGTVKHVIFDEGQELGMAPLVHNQTATITPSVGVETIDVPVEEPSETPDNTNPKDGDSIAAVIAANVIAAAAIVILVKNHKKEEEA